MSHTHTLYGINLHWSRGFFHADFYYFFHSFIDNRLGRKSPQPADSPGAPVLVVASYYSRAAAVVCFCFVQWLVYSLKLLLVEHLTCMLNRRVTHTHTYRWTITRPDLLHILLLLDLSKCLLKDLLLPLWCLQLVTRFMFNVFVLGVWVHFYFSINSLSSLHRAPCANI